MNIHKHVLASAALMALLMMDPVAAVADQYEDDPVGLFGGNGRYWLPRNGDGSGVIKLNSDGTVLMIWNRNPYRGTWQQDGQRIKTTWPRGVPFEAPSWRVRENPDPSKQYTATSSKP